MHPLQENPYGASQQRQPQQPQVPPPQQGYPYQAPQMYPPQGQPGGPYQTPPQMTPPGQTGAPEAPRRGVGRIIAGVLVTGVGVVAALGGGTIVARAVANSRQEIISKDYMRDLWRNVPVETIFPASIGVRDPDANVSVERGWTRVAISQDTSCKTALSGQFAVAAARHGCIAALRATYLDPGGGTAATAVVVALPNENDRSDLVDVLTRTQDDEGGADQAVHALGVPGLRWKDSARAGSGGTSVFAPYATAFVVVTSGPTDGRVAGHVPEPWGKGQFKQREDREPWARTAYGLAQTLSERLKAEAAKVRP
ncbi:hypothetical protein [Streptosporangium saharense]|uniref:hypothetical protein n=1 Tax=Streptosporangium saharense TaxID=1706840 RepID=UPI003680CD06